MRTLLLVLFATTVCLSACKNPAGAASKNALPVTRVSAENTDSAEPSITTAADGSVYLAWIEHHDKTADILVRRYDSNGHATGNAVRVNPSAGNATAWRGDPPALVTGTNGTLYVSWTATIPFVEKGNDLYLSASHDHGMTFQAPVKVNDDAKPGVHGMHSLAIGPGNKIFVVWLDERGISTADAGQGMSPDMHKMESNREVYLAISDDGGRSFGPNKKIAADACPCCKTSITAAADGHVYLGWRQVLPGDFRHIAVSTSSDKGANFSSPAIVNDDKWSIGGCPVSGASLLAMQDGTLGVLWYTAGEAGKEGLYWSISKDGGRSFEPRMLVNAGRPHGTPVLLNSSAGVQYAIWEEDKGTENGAGGPAVLMKRLSSAGASSEPTTLATNSSLPAAVVAGNRIYLAAIDGDVGKRSITLLETKN